MARSGGSKQRLANGRHASTNGNGGGAVIGSGVTSDGARWLRASAALVSVAVVVVAVWWAATRGHTDDANLDVKAAGAKHHTGSHAATDVPSTRENADSSKPTTVVSDAAARSELAQAQTESSRGKHDLAIRRLERLLRRGPPPDTVLDIRFELADAYTAMGNGDEVARQLQLADEHAQGRGAKERAAAAWAVAKLQLHRKTITRPELISILRRVIDADPNHDNALHWLGHQLMQSPEGYAEALVHLSRVRLSRLTDSHPLDTLMLLGQGHDRLGNLTATAAAFRRAVDLYRKTINNGAQVPDRIRFRFALSHFQLGKVFLLLGRNTQAMTIAEYASREFPDVYHIMDLYGLALAALSRWDEAIDHYRTVARIVAQWPSEHRTMPERVLGASLAKIKRDRAVAERGEGSNRGSDSEHASYGSDARGRHGTVQEGRDGGGKRDASNVVKKEGDAGVDDDANQVNVAENTDVNSMNVTDIDAKGDSRTIACGDNGGWPTVQVHSHTSSRCNIDRRPGLTVSEFIREYADRNLPVLIPGAMADWPANSVWRRDAFVAKYKDMPVRVRRSVDIAYDNEFGRLQADIISVEKYVDDVFGLPGGVHPPPLSPSQQGETKYVLGALGWGRGFREDYVAPAYFNATRKDGALLFQWNHSARDANALAFFGPAGSGVTLHEHTNAWNALVFGRKRWVLLPPYVHYGPTGLPVTTWLDEWYPRFADSAFECTQEAGEMLYVPTNYMHTLINLQASIGVAVEVGHHTQLLERLLADIA